MLQYCAVFFYGILVDRGTADELCKIEKGEWDKLIKEKCNQLGIQGVSPQFHLISGVRG
jgi:hypothetical protein